MTSVDEPRFDTRIDPDAALDPDQAFDPDSVDPDSVDPDSVDPDSVDPDSVDPNLVDPDAATGGGLGERLGDGIIVEDEDREPTSTLSLFEGDEGGLHLDQRKALVALMKNRFISARTHPRDWAGLIRNPRLIRSRLNDLFLDLALFPEQQVAWKRQIVPESGGRFPTLLTDLSWGREETVLLVFLRTQFRLETASGAERAYVDRSDMEQYVLEHRPPSATDIAADRKRTARAIESLYRSGLLLGRSDADRWEIANAIDVLMPMEMLKSVLAWMREQTAEPASAADRDTDGEERA
jgi:hypothetical protein